jgi:hypothetical protein
MVNSLPDNWLELAIAHASTGWLKQSLKRLLPALVNGEITSTAFAATISAQLDERRLTKPAQQKNYRSNVVQALKSIDAQHSAIALVGLSTEQYRDLNEKQRGRLNDRETKFLTHDDVEALVNQATTLLNSAEWSEVGAGLAVLVGRRISEILLSQFELKTAWSLSFSEMAKKDALTSGFTIEIPTLAPAPQVLAAIQRLQKALRIDDLRLASLTPKNAKQRVNNRYSGAIAKACHRHFAQLVPARADGENLYTHIFRAVYATIATHWFCPIHVPEYSFKAEIQGHFTLTQAGKKLPNYSARVNYDDYAIADGNGNRDGRLGIKLGLLPGLQVLEAFHHPTPIEPIDSISQTPTPAEIDIPLETQAMEIARASLDKETINALCYRATRLLASDRWAEVAVGLELLTGILTEVLSTAQVEAPSPYTLLVNGKEVKTLVQQLLPAIERFQHLAPGAIAEMEQVCEQTFGDLLPIERVDLAMLKLQILAARTRAASTQPITAAAETEANLVTHSPQATIELPVEESAPVRESAEPLSTKHPGFFASDLTRMHTLMAAQGVTGSPAEVFHALLETFEKKQTDQQQMQTLGEIGATFNWFTGEIQTLRARVAELERERDEFRAMQGQSEEIHQLRATNEQLKVELKQTLDRLHGIQKLLGMGDNPPSPTLAKLENPTPAIAPPPRQADKPEAAIPPVLSPKPELVRRNQGETTEKIHQIIDAIIAWNTSQDDSLLMLRISIPPIKAIASAMGANYQPIIQQVLKERQQELDELHRRLMLGTRHNASVNKKDEILQAIAQQYLELDNWQEIHF